MKSYKYRLCSVLFTCFTIWVFNFYFANFAVAAEYCVDTSDELQSALTDAETNGEDDIIKVQQGTYYGNFTFNSTEAYSLTIEGGYNHPRCKKRVVDPANTVLDGENRWRVLELNASDASANFVVDGITIRNGQVSGNLIRGGGLVVLTDRGTVTVSKSKIDSNSSPIEGGSGMYIEAADLLTLNNNTIIYNNGMGEGGGCHFDNCSDVNIFDNIIKGNSGWMGGGVYISSADSVVMTNNLVTNNTAHYAGGGTFIRSSEIVNLSNNILENNTSGTGGGGLWITSISSSVDLNKNTINNNTADHSGGAWLGCYGIIRLTNNAIIYNTATDQDAGGAWVDAGFYNTVITNNTISYNSCNIQGGGIRIGISGTADLYNNIIWNNSGSQGADLFIQNIGIPSQVKLFNNDLDLTSGVYIEDVEPIVFSNNLDNEDPSFVSGDYHLTDSSPCIDAGVDAGVYDDIDGDSRPQGLGYDIGADEFIALDLDISHCKATKRVSIGGNKNTVEIKLAVVNAGIANSGKTCPANVIGMQDSVEVYNETMGVSDQIGKGQTIFQFPDYVPTTEGEIIWTATIEDDDPDIDEASASTIVKP